MKYVREHINEKFKEESDPVYDMGIGMIRVIQKWAKTIHGYRGNPENLLWLSTRHGKDEYVKFLLEAGIYDKSILDWSLRIAASTGHAKIFEMLLKAGADIHTAQDRCKDLVANKPALKKIWAKYVEKEKSQNKKVNEKFQLDSDPIHDLGIGISHKIEKLKERIKNQIGNVNSQTTEKCMKNDTFLWAWAAYFGEKEIVQYYISKDIPSRMVFISSNIDVLCFAALANQIDIGILLVESGLDLEDTIRYANQYCNNKTIQGLNQIKEKIESRKNKNI